MEEESIYNLIPKEYATVQKGTKYISKYPHNTPPTASTFGIFTTSRVKATNINGDFKLTKGAHSSKGTTLTMGTSNQIQIRPHTVRPEDQSQIYQRIKTARCPPIPNRQEKPLLGLKTNKNFITANAVEQILSAPKIVKQQSLYLHKENYGQVPKYLKDIKKNISSEYEMIQSLHQQEVQEQESQKQLLQPSEIEQLKKGIKMKYDYVQKEYQALTHKKVDTIGIKKRKEDCERQLIQLEKDMEKLNKQYIFVDRTS